MLINDESSRDLAERRVVKMARISDMALALADEIEASGIEEHDPEAGDILSQIVNAMQMAGAWRKELEGELAEYRERSGETAERRHRESLT